MPRSLYFDPGCLLYHTDKIYWGKMPQVPPSCYNYLDWTTSDLKGECKMAEKGWLNWEVERISTSEMLYMGHFTSKFHSALYPIT